jgi:hypothetical protein
LLTVLRHNKFKDDVDTWEIHIEFKWDTSIERPLERTCWSSRACTLKSQSAVATYHATTRRAYTRPAPGSSSASKKLQHGIKYLYSLRRQPKQWQEDLELSILASPDDRRNVGRSRIGKILNDQLDGCIAERRSKEQAPCVHHRHVNSSNSCAPLALPSRQRLIPPRFGFFACCITKRALS